MNTLHSTVTDYFYPKKKKKLFILNQTIKTKTSAPSSNQDISVTVKHNLQNNSVAGLPNKKENIHGQIYEVEQEG